MVFSGGEPTDAACGPLAHEHKVKHAFTRDESRAFMEAVESHISN